ncbi:hypothetical protein EVAR_72701_1 [Eumeta japonica]|uniref:Uncharacterized protein n=1 Tax=Eumeta variegata TaxID=151549 RepID=A0A4C1SXS6_EUMVA|nr:hypothetical protein EVAR_72701_1 [Eumeta japonica]
MLVEIVLLDAIRNKIYIVILIVTEDDPPEFRRQRQLGAIPGQSADRATGGVLPDEIHASAGRDYSRR